jgi:cell division protein FtsW
MSFGIVFFMAFFLNVKFLEQTKFQKWMMLIIVGLLCATLVIGSNINGSKSWINLGFMNLQASELLKIALILYIPYMIEKKRPRVFKQPKLLTSPIVLAAFCIGLVLLQKDVGQTLLIIIIFFSIIFYAGIGVEKTVKYLLVVVIGVVVVGGLALLFGLVPHYLTARFSTLLNPFSNEAGTLLA